MANRSDLELALRLKADLQQGQQALQALEQNVRDVGDASDVASTKLQAASQADAVEPKKPEGMSEQDFHNMRHVFGDDVFAQAQKD